MREIGLIVRHDLRLLRRNSRLLLSGASGFAIMLLMLSTAIEESVAGPQITGLFLLLIASAAVAMPMVLAIHAFVGEKERRTMETLLLLPISLPRLVVGKAVVTVVLSLLLIVLVFTTGIVMVSLVGEPAQRQFLLNGLTVYVAAVLGPLFVTLYTLVALIISGRSNNVQAALNLGVFVAAPALVVPFAIWFGRVGINRSTLFFATVAVAILCVVAFRIAFALLRPEALLSRLGR